MQAARYRAKTGVPRGAVNPALKGDKAARFEAKALQYERNGNTAKAQRARERAWRIREKHAIAHPAGIRHPNTYPAFNQQSNYLTRTTTTTTTTGMPMTGLSATGLSSTGLSTTGMPMTAMPMTGLSTTGYATTGYATTGSSTTTTNTVIQQPVQTQQVTHSLYVPILLISSSLSRLFLHSPILHLRLFTSTM